MNDVLESLNVTPNVTISEEKFRELMELATANAQEIEKRALKLWEQKGVAGVKVEVYLKATNVGQDIIDKKYVLVCQANDLHVSPAAGYTDIEQTFGKPAMAKIAKFAANVANDIFLKAFGEQLSRINEIFHLKVAIRHEWRMTRAFTLTGWLTAIALFIILMILN